MEYRTLYDAFTTNYLFNGLMIFLAVLPVWSALSFFIWARSKHKITIVRAICMSFIIASFAMLTSLSLLIPTYKQYILYSFKNGQGIVTEGIVREKEYEECEYERFKLNGIAFSIKPICGRSKPLFFNTPGILAEGTYVRISTLDSYILKVEAKP